MIYTISVNGNAQITTGGQARAGTASGDNVYDAGNRILTQNYVTVDLRNLLPDGTTPRSMAMLKACSFVCAAQGNITAATEQIGSIRIMNVACPNQRQLVVELFAVGSLLQVARQPLLLSPLISKRQ